MATVIKLNDYKDSLNVSPAIDISFIEMALDEGKRQSIFAKYDKNYRSAEEEDEIFNMMTARRKGRDK